MDSGNWEASEPQPSGPGDTTGLRMTCASSGLFLESSVIRVLGVKHPAHPELTSRRIFSQLLERGTEKTPRQRSCSPFSRARG